MNYSPSTHTVQSNLRHFVTNYEYLLFHCPLSPLSSSSPIETASKASTEAQRLRRTAQIKREKKEKTGRSRLIKRGYPPFSLFFLNKKKIWIFRRWRAPHIRLRERERGNGKAGMKVGG